MPVCAPKCGVEGALALGVIAPGPPVPGLLWPLALGLTTVEPGWDIDMRSVPSLLIASVRDFESGWVDDWSSGDLGGERWPIGRLAGVGEVTVDAGLDGGSGGGGIDIVKSCEDAVPSNAARCRQSIHRPESIQLESSWLVT